MATTKAKRSIRRAQPRTIAKRSTRRPTKAGRRNNRRTLNRTASAKKQMPKLLPGDLLLIERTLPGRRFVDFPQVVGKTIKRVHIFTASEYNCVTIDLDDHTALNLAIEPGFAINAELQHIHKGEIEIIAEWPAIPSQQ